MIYLLNETERAKLIQDCYNQLIDNGLMVFTVISKLASSYGQGKYLSKDRFEMPWGVNLFFYDNESIVEAFGKVGLFEIVEVTESMPFYLIKCRKMTVENEFNR